MRLGNFIGIWVGVAVIAAAPRPVNAMGIFECGESVMRSVRAWRLGVPVRPVAAEQTTPIELEDLSPEFQFVRRGFSVYLLEKHSQTRLYFIGGVLTAKVPVGDLESADFYSEEIELDEAERELFFTLFREVDLAKLDAPALAELTRFFSGKVCTGLFEMAQKDLLKQGGENGEPDFKINGSFVWRLPDVDNRHWVGFQVEGWLDRRGEVVLHRLGGGLGVGNRWAVLRLIVGKGLVEIRALPTDSLVPGYHFIRVPQGRLMNAYGHFEKNIERFAISHYDETLERGQLVNGDHFPYHHRHITRALETGLDPENGYSKLSYLNRQVMMVSGMFAGRRAMVYGEREAVMSPSGGYRRELDLTVEDHPISVNMFTASVVPILEEPMLVGLDPVTRIPMEFAIGEEVHVRNAGERAQVVEVYQGRGPVKVYEVKYLTGPLTGQIKAHSTGELIALKYLPLEWKQAPDLRADLRRSGAPEPSNPIRPTSDPAP